MNFKLWNFELFANLQCNIVYNTQIGKVISHAGSTRSGSSSSVSVCLFVCLSVCLASHILKTALKGLRSCSVRVKTPFKVNMLFPKMFSKNWNSCHNSCHSCCCCLLLKQPKNGSNHILLELRHPLKLVCYFQKCFQQFETAAKTAATAVVTVYYIKTV